MTGNNGTTNYRARLELLLRSTYGPDTVEELLSGYADQAVREHQRRALDHSQSGVPVDHVLSDALVKGLGYTREAADHTVTGVTRDGESYRILADAVDGLIHSESDPDDWDGDDSEVSLLTEFLSWLPDLIRHDVAEKLRAKSLTYGSLHGQLLRAIAGQIDPVECDGDGRWIRKSDDAAVPWNVVKG
jgi:hypothetical protein